MELPLPRGFYLRLHDQPENERDRRVLMNFFRLELNIMGDIATGSVDDPHDDVESIRFDGPYSQGGIMVEVAKGSLYPPPEMDTFHVPWGIFHVEDDDPMEKYTGWCMYDNYWDSMTNRFFSPIFEESDGTVFIREM